MITPENIKEHLNRRPFRPFRVVLSDGSQQEVPHPELAWVLGDRLFVGKRPNGASNADWRVEELAILHVTRLAELKARKPKRS